MGGGGGLTSLAWIFFPAVAENQEVWPNITWFFLQQIPIWNIPGGCSSPPCTPRPVRRGGGGGGGAGVRPHRPLGLFFLSERLVMYDWYPYSVSGKLTHKIWGRRKKVTEFPPPPPHSSAFSGVAWLSRLAAERVQNRTPLFKKLLTGLVRLWCQRMTGCHLPVLPGAAVLLQEDHL